MEEIIKENFRFAIEFENQYTERCCFNYRSTNYESKIASEYYIFCSVIVSVGNDFCLSG